MEFYYGIESREHLDLVTKAVCRNLGGKPRLAQRMLLETCAVETQLGTYPDRHPDRLGVGAYQCDQINLDDIQLNTDLRHKKKIARLWGYDIDEVELSQLADDLLLATIICRLTYMRFPEPIPTNYFDRARYWKKKYNTSAGKGTFEHYLESAERFGFASLEDGL